jgi:hypothetical protein
MAQRGNAANNAGMLPSGNFSILQEYHQFLFYLPLKQDSHASTLTLRLRLLHCHDFCCKDATFL